jgi:hypothetical protein
MGSSGGTAVRLLREGDEEPLERFLSEHRDSSTFLRANARLPTRRPERRSYALPHPSMCTLSSIVKYTSCRDITVFAGPVSLKTYEPSGVSTTAAIIA